MHKIIGDYQSFISSINYELDNASIDTRDLAMLDHLCYRVETQDRYDELKQRLSDHDEYLGEATVGGRQISTFEFTDPLEAGGWRIPYLELPEPKAGSPYKEGLEHAEFVVIGGLSRFLHKYDRLTFETKALTKKINPEIGLKLGTVSVKFHEQPLGSIVRLEQSLGL